MHFTPELYFAYASSRPDGRVVEIFLVARPCERSVEDEIRGEDDDRDLRRVMERCLYCDTCRYLMLFSFSFYSFIYSSVSYSALEY